jgi:hypothetical protein
MPLIEPKSSKKLGSGEKDMDGVDKGKTFRFSADSPQSSFKHIPLCVV